MLKLDRKGVRQDFSKGQCLMIILIMPLVILLVSWVAMIILLGLVVVPTFIMRVRVRYLAMAGFYSRYAINYDATDGHLEIVDSLASNLGGDGTLNVKDVESIRFYNNVFELRIAGGDASAATNYSLYMQHTLLEHKISSRGNDLMVVVIF